jgi:hypothetical protein
MEEMQWDYDEIKGKNIWEELIAYVPFTTYWVVI